MEPNTPYALYDDAARPQRWAAHVRLTPELLRRLQAAPAARVALALGGGRSKRPSVLSVADGDESDEALERYELLSFPEDARVTHVCALRRAAAGDAEGAEGGGGYALVAAGRVHQKLLVQRLLDSAEKGRIKDRHAQSVRDSRARASKLLEEQPSAAGSKRRRVALGTWTAGGSTKAAVEAEAAPLKMVLRSALSAEDARRAREKIERGFEKQVAVLTAGAPAAPPTRRPKAATAGGESLFSSDSDASDREDAAQQATAADPGPQEAAEAPKAAAPAKQPRKPQPAKQAVESSAAAPQLERDAPVVAAVATVATTSREPAVREKSEPAALPKVKRQPLAAAETKRPLPRAIRIPDLAFFPPAVAPICKRVSTFITRSAILDDADYSAFEQQYEAFYTDWETLDKAYSIEVIKTEGLHVRLRFARDEQERAALEHERSENAKRSEALAFVRDAMASIQKILSSLQASIARFDERQQVA